jgi:hypothetical protein
MTDLTLAINKDAMTRIVRAVTNIAAGSLNTTVKLNKNVRIDVKAQWHIEDDYRLTFDDSASSIQISELDLIFDVLELRFTVDVPTQTLGGNCVVPNPLTGKCLVRLPSTTLFSSASDLVIPVVLNGIRSELSGELALNMVHFDTDAADDLNAAARGYRDRLLGRLEELAPDAPPELLDFFRMAWADGWELRAEAHWADVDLLDLPDMAGDELDKQLNRAIAALGSGLPANVRTVLKAVAGGVSHSVRAVLDLPDDLEEFLLDVITRIDLVEKALEDLSNSLGFLYLVKIPDRAKFEVNRGIPPVMIDVTNAAVEFDAHELKIMLDVGVPEAHAVAGATASAS